jgi:hypothetical protein
MTTAQELRANVIAGLILRNRGWLRYPFGPGWARVCLDVMEHIRRRP